MKKISTLLLFAAAVGSANAASIYDCMTGVSSYTTSTTSPGYTFGDGANSIVAPGSGMAWSITSIDFGVFFVGAQSFASGQLLAKINIYASYDGSGADPVMGSLVGTVNYTLGAITTTGNAAYGITGGTLGTPINLAAGTKTMGWTLSFYDTLHNNARLANVRPGFTTTVLPSAGTSPIGFYRDNNDDGIIQANENRVFGSGTDPSDNMIIRFNGTAQAVPEPASMVALGLGAAAFVKRRRASK